MHGLSIAFLTSSLVGGRHGGGRGHDALAGTTVKIRQGPYKGYRGRVVEVKGQSVRVELESQMKVVTGKFWTIGGTNLSENFYGVFS